MSGGHRSPLRWITAHRFRFQLAPLVDLLLIIVFAQFLEVRQTADADSQKQQQQMEEIHQQMTDTDQQLVDISQKMVDINQEKELLQTVVQTSRTQLQNERDRTAKAMGAVAEMFNLSASDVESFASSEDGDIQDVVERVRGRAQRLATDSPETVMRFLVGHEELLKRAEIWNLHVDQRRQVTLSVGDLEEVFQLEQRGQDARTTEFEDALFASYKQLPQPKELVVILVSYSPDAVAGVYQPMINAVPLAVERMRADDPTTRFEYTVLGTTQTP